MNTKTKEVPILTVTGAQPAAIAAARAAIMAILSAPHADQKTKRAALKHLDTMVGVNNLTITGCTLIRNPAR